MDGNQTHDPLFDQISECLSKLGSAPHYRDAQKLSAADSSSAAKANESSCDNATQAINLRDNTVAGLLYLLVNSSMPANLSADAFKLYRDKFLLDAGNPTDPIEVQLIEQLSMAHFMIGRLYLRACSMDNAKLSIAFTDAATRLLGELRRCSLALEDFRAKQIARKEQPAINDVAAEKVMPATRNGKPRPSTNGKAATNGKPSPNGKASTNGKHTNAKKAPASTKQGSNGHSSEIPECLQNRMTPQIQNVLPPAAATASNGKA